MLYDHLPNFDGVRRLDTTTLLRRPIDRPSCICPHIIIFFILHEVLELQIIYHNNRVAACGQPLAFGSVLLGLVDFDFVREYFWDELG